MSTVQVSAEAGAADASEEGRTGPVGRTRRPGLGGLWDLVRRQRRMSPLLAAGAVASVVGLLSTVLVARLLSPADYGALTKLLGLFLVLSLPGTALMVGVVRRVTAWQARGQHGLAKRWVKRAHRAGTLSVGALVLAVFLAREPLSHALKLPSSSGLVEAIAAGGVWILVAMDRGVLQCDRRYAALSVNIVVEGIARMVVMIVLPAVGVGLQGAALGILAGELAAAAHVRWALARRGRRAEALVPVDAAAGTLHTRADLAVDVVVAMAAMGLLAALQNVDVIVFGSRAPAHSGAYGAISVPSKALVFLALLLGNYLLPEASIQFQRGGHALAQLRQLLVTLALPAMVLLAVAAVAPHSLLGLVFGTKYEAGAPGFSALVLSMMCLCITNLLTVYLLAVGWRWVVVPLAVGTGLLVLLCWHAGTSLTGTAHADLGAQGALALAMVVAFVLRHRLKSRSVRVLTS